MPPCLSPPPPPSLPQGLASQLGGQRLGAEQVAGALLGQRCWVKWPYLQEAVVEGVSDAGERRGVALPAGVLATWSLLAWAWCWTSRC